VIKKLINKAKQGKSVYITDVKRLFKSVPDAVVIKAVLMPFDKTPPKEFTFCLPPVSGFDSEEISFVQEYITAGVYNIISTFGGRRMDFYIPEECEEILTLFKNLEKDFCIHLPRSKREKYGRSINVTDRMLEGLSDSSMGTGEEGFSFRFFTEEYVNQSVKGISGDGRKNPASAVFQSAASGLDKKKIIGVDVGGTDIKLVTVRNGEIVCIKEYNWFPARFTQISEIIEPIILLIRFMRNWLFLLEKSDNSDCAALLKEVDQALPGDAPDDVLAAVADKIEAVLGTEIPGVDGIGLCFPDVVIKNKIVGGEVYKTRGIRNNPGIDYEKDFRCLTHLDNELKIFLNDDGIIKFTNDGPMAAFTAAVELSAGINPGQLDKGIFAHTLGTELGTGWVDEKGCIPEIPLEVYNYIIDLGNYPGKKYEHDDVRSIKNFNTDISGTLQKYACQSGVFRLAVQYFSDGRKDLYQELFARGFLVWEERKGAEGLYVPTEPEDMRKPFLEYLMSLPDRDDDELIKEIWREIGRYLAVTWFETKDIIDPEAESRILFGRLIKNQTCFDLMVQGAKELAPDIVLTPADSSIANTPLMKQLQEDPEYTVAQFAQAVGAVYFANK